MVTENNNNKFYNMEDDGNNIVVVYGRVGTSGTEVSYPSSQWDKLYRAKTKKGYVDISSFKQEAKISGAKEIDNENIRDIVNLIISRAKTKIADNYLVSYKDVTQKQIDEAQEALDSVIAGKKHKDVEAINRSLISLYTIIPRKMKNVKNHLLIKYDASWISETLKDEQELLDNMATQVAQCGQDDDSPDKDVLQMAGIAMEEISTKEEKLIKEKLGANAHQFRRAFKIKHLANEKRYKQHLKKVDNKETELFWHGSRTENWWSILSSGLLIRPSNAVYTGAMFDSGLYFADKAQKSIGYTSLNSSYWARGNDRTAYMCLYEVHVGKQKIVEEHNSSCYTLSKTIKGQYDSVYAKAGRSLRNNEFIVYNEAQCTPRYFVEIGDR
jgi:poly [ADP-ribose] polymerase